MPRFLFDTDHLTLFDHADVSVWRRFSQCRFGDVALSPISVEEYLRGRLAALARHQGGPQQVQAYRHLVDTLDLFQQLSILPFDLASERRCQQLRAMRLRVGTQDLRIGAVALMNNLTLVTRNRRDFSRIPGLALADWSV